MNTACTRFRLIATAVLMLGLVGPSPAQDFTDPIYRTGMENHACPNGIREDVEQCDDNNGIAGDMCAPNCRFFNCGDSVLDAPFEECDDGNTVSGDGCDSRFCFTESGWSCSGTPSLCAPTCGDGVLTGGETCDDDNTSDGDGCSASCQTESGYQCVGQPSVCTAVICGNGIIESGETCDDQNTTGGDGCSALCAVESPYVCSGAPSLCVLPEMEPNEDGSPSTSTGTGIFGSDYGTPTASNAEQNSGVHLLTAGRMLRRFSLSPAGDEDVFVIENDDTFTRTVRADTWRTTPGFGIGVACGNTVDTGLNLRNRVGPMDDGLAAPPIQWNDDRNGASDACSGFSFDLAPGARRYLQVTEFGDNAAILEDMLLAVTSVRRPCGNGIIEAGLGEVCDDGNADSGDGCSALCAVEPSFTCVAEPSLCYGQTGEPNDDGAVSVGGSIEGNDFGPPTIANVQANGGAPLLTSAPGVVRRTGTIGVAGDEDAFAVTNDDPVLPKLVRIESWSADPDRGEGTTCQGRINTRLAIRDQVAGGLGPVEVAGIDRYARLDDRCDVVNLSLAPNTTRWLHVIEENDDEAAGAYFLTMRSELDGCGDGQRGGLEECDDGNRTAGDGCSATCMEEIGFQCAGSPSQCLSCAIEGDIEPNNSAAQAVGPLTVPGMTCTGDINGIGDVDYYTINLPTSASLAIGTLEPESRFFCNGDSEIRLLAADGVTQLAFDDDDGPDTCSELSAERDPALLRMAPGQYFVAVNERGNNTQIIGYRLETRVLSQCANGIVEPQETCDDGNTVVGDGCTDQCVLEPGFQCIGAPSVCGRSEVEPNEDGTPSGGGGASGNDVGPPTVANASAGGINRLAQGDVRRFFRIDPAGDEDVFVVENNDTNTRIVTTQVSGATTGIGADCVGDTDPAMSLRSAVAGGLGASEAFSDDEGTSLCPQLQFTLPPGQVKYLQVLQFSDSGAIPEDLILGISSVRRPCGDGTIGMGEVCDDGNEAGGDGCSATCTVESGYVCAGEPSFCGIPDPEPNDDGAVAPGGPNFLGNDAGAPTVANTTASIGIRNLSTGIIRIDGNLFPAGDEDIVGIRNDTATGQTVRADVWRMHPGFGEGVSCGSRFDSLLRVADASAGGLSATTIVQNDDRASGDFCSRVSFALLPGETRYAQLMERNDDAEFPGYRLVFQATPSVCGNWRLEPGEQCDDGNLATGDFCSATCTITNDAAESEPNGSIADVVGNDNFAQADYLLRGSISPVGDRDFVGLRAGVANTVVRLESYTSLFDCPTATMTLGLLDAVGAVIAADANSGIGNCAAITMPISTADHFFRIGETGDNGLIADYLLEVRFHADVGPESEPNDTLATASTMLDGQANAAVRGSHANENEADWYRITVPAGASVRAELVEFDRGLETCESNGIDSRITLFDAGGTQLATDDDSGRGFCSLIDGKGAAPKNPTAVNNTGATQTWYLRVDASPGVPVPARQFDYRLAVSIR